MRPRVFPAEDRNPRGEHHEDHRGFNEAAGIPRGRLTTRALYLPTTLCFNEAAGIPRGRPGHGSPPRPSPRSFNEAAGIPRGRQEYPGLQD